MSERKYDHLLDEWIKLYTEEDHTLKQIADQCEASKGTISEYLQEAGVEVKRNEKQYKHLTDRWVRLYTEEGWTTTHIANQCEAPSRTISKYLREAGVEMRSNKIHTHLVDEWSKLYDEEKLSVRQIADQYEATRQTIREYLKEAGTEMREPGGGKPRHNQFKDEWIRLYTEEHLSTEKIAEEYEAIPETISKYLRDAGVEMRGPGFKENELTKEILLERASQSNECWTWKSLTINNYGVISINGSTLKAHRAAYRVWKSKIPKDKIVRHKCDNKRCIRPNHLELGTQQENVNDIHQVKRDLHALTQDDLRDILGREEEDWLQIAEDHDVRLATVRYILEEK